MSFEGQRALVFNPRASRTRKSGRQAGANAFCRNDKKMQPVDYARKGGHHDVVVFLESLRAQWMGRLGSGGDYNEAMDSNLKIIQARSLGLAERRDLRRDLCQTFYSSCYDSVALLWLRFAEVFHVPRFNHPVV